MIDRLVNWYLRRHPVEVVVYTTHNRTVDGVPFAERLVYAPDTVRLVEKEVGPGQNCRRSRRNSAQL
jgi:hypothetical protein